MDRTPRRAHVVAVTAAGLVSVALLLTVMAPVHTDDIWWHLAAGEHYLREGLWPTSDPLLHTGLETGPVQHEWLFGVVVHLIKEAFGFHGLRLAHGLLVALILLALWRTARARRADATQCALLVAVFVVLAWFRLFQLRPDLASILTTVLVYRVALKPVGHIAPGWWIAALSVLFAVWANMHSLFLVGINLVIAAILGALMHAALARMLLDVEERPAELGRATGHARTLLILAVTCALVAAVNPRGFANHLTFFTSSSESAIWHVTDEWSSFNPFRWQANHPSVSRLTWAAANAVFVLFLLSVAARVYALLRERTRDALIRFDCVGFGLALASVVAISVSIRFLWMGLFPLAYVVLRAVPWQTNTSLRGWLYALAGVALMLGFVLDHGVQNLIARYGPAPRDYTSQGYASHKYHAEGVHFLFEAGLEGRLFNDYEIGGFLGYWLAPSLRTFIDSRAEHYPYELYSDYSSIMRMRTTLEEIEWLEVLDRRKVDVFFGVGFPGWWRKRDTTQYLRDIPGWRLVSRSYRNAIYLRVNERNAENLRRITRYYQDQGVPFDAARGLDPARVIRERPDWALAHAMLPRGFENLSKDDRSAVLALVGAYGEQVARDRAIIEVEPAALKARARLAYGLLRLDRPLEALSASKALSKLAPDSRQARQMARAVHRYIALRGDDASVPIGLRKRSRINRHLRQASPLDAGDTWPIEYLMHTEGYELVRRPR